MQRTTIHYVLRGIRKTAIIAMQHHARQNSPWPVNITAHLNDHPPRRTGMARP
jgi:hypothetical protein